MKRLVNRPYDPYRPPAVSADELEDLAPAHIYMRPLAPRVRPPERPQVRDAARLLICDSDPLTRRMLHILLAHPNISLMEAEDGEAALDLLATRTFDVVLLALDMPKLNGPDTLAWIRRSPTPWSDVPIIGLAGDDDQRLVGQLWAEGLTDCLCKPLIRGELEQKLQGLLPGLFDAGL